MPASFPSRRSVRARTPWWSPRAWSQGTRELVAALRTSVPSRAENRTPNGAAAEPTPATTSRHPSYVRRTAQAMVMVGVVAGVSGWSVLHKGVTVDIDGHLVAVDTFAKDVDGVLASAGIVIGDADLVQPALGEVISDGATVVVRRAEPVELLIDGQSEIVMTSAETVGELLGALGARGENAFVATSRSGRVDRGAGPLTVSTQKVVRVAIDGELLEFETAAPTVGEVFTEFGLVLDDRDTVSVPLAAPTVDGMVVMVSRFSTSDDTERTVIPFKTVEIEDATLTKGTKIIKTHGKVGERVLTYRAVMEDGLEVRREVIAEAVISDAVDQVVRVGTKALPKIAPVAPGSARAIGKDLAAKRGWGDDQFVCLDNLWTRESGWRHTAHNRSSGAYGIPQALPGSKMASAGADWRTNPTTQITWGLNYIKSRYKTPCGAWNHFQVKRWY